MTKPKIIPDKIFVSDKYLDVYQCARNKTIDEMISNIAAAEEVGWVFGRKLDEKVIIDIIRDEYKDEHELAKAIVSAVVSPVLKSRGC